MRLSRDTLLVIGLLALLVVVSTIAALNQPSEPPLPLSIRSTAPGGTRAFRLWMEALGHRVDDRLLRSYRVPDGTDLVVIFEPTFSISVSDRRELERHVDSGGSVLLVGRQFPTVALAQELGIVTQPILSASGFTGPALPGFDSPLITSTVDYRPPQAIARDHPGVTLLANASRPAAVALDQGRGRWIVTTAVGLFTNEGLRERERAALALHLVNAAAGPINTIWFDEWHQGRRMTAPTSAEVIGPEAWLLRTPGGWAVLLTVVILFIGLALSGRAFGRPVPSPRELVRRTPLEYITAIANLNRRAGHRDQVAAHYRLQLKRTLGRRYRLDPSLPDEAFLNALSATRPTINRAALSALLARLNRATRSDSDLVQLSAEVAMWTKDPL